MPLDIRLITPADYGGVARLGDVIAPQSGRSSDDLREADRRRDARMKYGGMLAELEGEVVGFGIYTQYPDLYEPDKVVLWGGVHPEHRARGVGRALFQVLEEHLSTIDVRRVQVAASEGDTAARAFLERHGFRIAWRRIEGRLNVWDASVSAVRVLETKVAEAGVRVVTYPDLVGDRERDRKLRDLNWRLEKDVAFGELPTRMTLDQFVRERIEPLFVLRDALFVAVAGREYVGMSSLRSGGAGRFLDTDFTGVLPSHRGRSIATLLKLKGIVYAREHGYAEIRVVNDEQNGAMWRINRRLGFVPQPARLRFEKRLGAHP